MTSHTSSDLPLLSRLDLVTGKPTMFKDETLALARWNVARRNVRIGLHKLDLCIGLPTHSLARKEVSHLLALCEEARVEYQETTRRYKKRNRAKARRMDESTQLRRDRDPITKRSTYTQIYDDYWYTELKAICKKRNMKRSGRKSVLIKRIMENVKNPTRLTWFHNFTSDDLQKTPLMQRRKRKRKKKKMLTIVDEEEEEDILTGTKRSRRSEMFSPKPKRQKKIN